MINFYRTTIRLLFSCFLGAVFWITPNAMSSGDKLSAQAVQPFAGLVGRWVGEGRLGYSSGQNEKIRCRLTYFVKEAGHKLKQNIRCGTSGAKIEIKSDILHDQGTLTGTWRETTYDMKGSLRGRVTPEGFVVFVKSERIDAIMQISQNAKRQIVEIQFRGSEIIGMTLGLRKG